MPVRHCAEVVLQVRDGPDLQLGPMLVSCLPFPVHELDEGVYEENLAAQLVRYALSRGLPAHWELLVEQEEPAGMFWQVWRVSKAQDGLPAD